jgi:hypothetical protein
MSGDSMIQLSGHRYKARRLRDHDELQVGTTRLLFEEPAQVEIDSLKGAPDQPLRPSEKPAQRASQPPRDSKSPGVERTETAEVGGAGEPSQRPEAAASVAPRTGPTVAELVIYALAIAVLLASGLALALLLRAR